MRDPTLTPLSTFLSLTLTPLSIYPLSCLLPPLIPPVLVSPNPFSIVSPPLYFYLCPPLLTPSSSPFLLKVKAVLMVCFDNLRGRQTRKHARLAMLSRLGELGKQVVWLGR